MNKLLLLSIITFSVAYSQISFTNIPANLQLFPRDQQDSAIVKIEGIEYNNQYDSIHILVYKNNSFINKISCKIENNKFSLSQKIHAELSEYRFNIFADTSLIITRDSLVCGDAFIIAGQSNGHPSDTACKIQNEFCRTLGIQTGMFNYDKYNPADTLWGLANGNGLGGYFSGKLLTGVWGIKLQQMIVENYGIPVCIINGAAGGSHIQANLRNGSNPMDLTSIYGKLLYRVVKAGINKNIKAIFWYQGEEDRYNYKSYSEQFGYLYNAWMQDYPGFEIVYLFQIRQGCSYHGKDGNNFREVQRDLPKIFDKVKLFSTTNIDEYKLCHYYLSGYYQIAKMVFLQVARDFYNSKDTLYINPPNIKKAYYSNDDLILEFDQPITITQTLIDSMKNYFFINDSTGLVNSVISDFSDKIVLKTSYKGGIKISYTPPEFYNGTQIVYVGPWVINKREIGALIFHDFPIDTLVENTITEYMLSQNYPNPFNLFTIIIYKLPVVSKVTLKVYDLLGREVETLLNENETSGYNTVKFNAGNLPSGVYFYQIQTDNFIQTRKMILLK